MNCIEIRELLPLYIDHMLESHQMIEIEDHLKSCDACTQEYEELLEMLSLFSTIEEVPVPKEFDLRLHEALKKEMEDAKNTIVMPNKKAGWNKWRRISSIAAVFVVGLFSVFLYNNSNGFHVDSLMNAIGIANVTDQAAKDDASDTPILKRSVAVSDQETTPADIKSEIKSSKISTTDEASGRMNQQETLNEKKEALISQEDTTSQSETSDQNLDQAKYSLKTAMTTEGATSPSDEVTAQTTIDESKEKSSYDYTDSFNPSRFLETLNSEDAQIYKELLNANIYLSSGRDSNAVIYYVKQMNRVLGNDCVYKFISCYQEPEGLWNIEISITTEDENGNEIQEVVTYCGQDGELWKKELS